MKNMKRTLITAMWILFANAVQADINYDFNGEWQGKGKLQEGTMVEAIDASFEIHIKSDKSGLSILECWTVPDAIIGEKKSCYRNEFSVNKSDQILDGDKHIGDIYPRYMMTFRGNSQVSELMKFGITTSGALIFNYNYSNYDGGMAVRSCRLTRKQ